MSTAARFPSTASASGARLGGIDTMTIITTTITRARVGSG